MVNFAGKTRFKFFWHEVRFAIAVKSWSGLVEGNMALTESGDYVIMADYDKCPLEIVDFELKAIQKKYDLGNFYVLESSPGKWHAICFDKVNFGTYKEVLQQLRIDPGYLQSRTWVLRYGVKRGFVPKLHHVLAAESGKVRSRAHVLLYAEKLPEMRDYLPRDNLDDSKILMGVKYTT